MELNVTQKGLAGASAGADVAACDPRVVKLSDALALADNNKQFFENNISHRDVCEHRCEAGATEQELSGPDTPTTGTPTTVKSKTDERRRTGAFRVTRVYLSSASRSVESDMAGISLGIDVIRAIDDGRYYEVWREYCEICPPDITHPDPHGLAVITPGTEGVFELRVIVLLAEPWQAEIGEYVTGRVQSPDPNRLELVNIDGERRIFERSGGAWKRVS